MKRGSSTPGEPVTVFAAIPENELPAPGASITVHLSNPKRMNLVATVYNVRGSLGDAVFRTPKSLTYVPVSTDSEHEEVVHAAVARRVNRRIRTERYTLCDRQGMRVAKQRVAGTLDDAVTCQQCRAQLVEDGMLDSEEPPSNE